MENGKPLPEYMDMVSVKLEMNDDVCVFSMKVASPVPDKPILEQGVKMQFWYWVINSDLNAWSQGPWPFPPAHMFWYAPEFRIVVKWDGEMFSAFLVDYRPRQAGGEVLFRDVPFVINEKELSVTVEAWMLGDLTDFFWGASTVDWIAEHTGNFAMRGVDTTGLGHWQP